MVGVRGAMGMVYVDRVSRALHSQPVDLRLTQHQSAREDQEELFDAYSLRGVQRE